MVWCVTVLLCWGCRGREKTNIDLISANFESEIQQKWFLYDFRSFVEYGVIGLSTYADLRFKNAIDSSGFCERSTTYQFLSKNVFSSFNDISCNSDTLSGRWELLLGERKLIIENGAVFPPYVGRLLSGNALYLPEDSVTFVSSVYELEKANSAEMVLKEGFREVLNQEKWDRDRDRYEALFGDIRRLLPITVWATSYYTLRPRN